MNPASLWLAMICYCVTQVVLAQTRIIQLRDDDDRSKRKWLEKNVVLLLLEEKGRDERE